MVVRISDQGKLTFTLHPHPGDYDLLRNIFVHFLELSRNVHRFGRSVSFSVSIPLYPDRFMLLY